MDGGWERLNISTATDWEREDNQGIGILGYELTLLVEIGSVLQELIHWDEYVVSELVRLRNILLDW